MPGFPMVKNMPDWGLVRFSIGDAEVLAPFSEQVHERFQGWLAMQKTAGRNFTHECWQPAKMGQCETREIRGRIEV